MLILGCAHFFVPFSLISIYLRNDVSINKYAQSTNACVPYHFFPSYSISFSFLILAVCLLIAFLASHSYTYKIWKKYSKLALEFFFIKDTNSLWRTENGFLKEEKKKQEQQQQKHKATDDHTTHT